MRTKTTTLIVCDAQPDVVRKLPQPRLFLDLLGVAVQAARKQSQSVDVVHTMLRFDQPAYAQVSPSHPRLGVLRRLGAKNPNLKWFTASDLSPTATENETVVTRSTFLPQATDAALLKALGHDDGERRHLEEDDDEAAEREYTVIGYGPTVQAVCHLLGDVVEVGRKRVQILKECVADENPKRCEALLEHGLLFNEQVVSLVDFLDGMDVLHHTIEVDNANNSSPLPDKIKYVTDCGRGGHLTLFMPYLLRDYGYCRWPTQPWYREMSLTSNKEYQCPVGRRIVDLCDEPQFGSGTRFFLAGRQHLDEKNLLHQLVPEMMPPTFETIEAAREYAATQSANETLVWFLKKVNQNGGRAITVINELPTQPLEKDEQLQVHVPRPLLYEKHGQDQGKFKCHVKTYQFIACTTAANGGPPEATTSWQLYMHDLFYLATANCPWSPADLSDDVQITTMRTHRLYADNPWRLKWKLTETCRANMQIVLQRAIEQGKLRHPTVSSTSPTDSSAQQQNGRSKDPRATLQFEVNSADWMLDEDGRMFLIECNGIPVLYDAGMPQELCTKGLKLYDRLYKENPDTAVVNDHDLIKEAIGLALTGRLPKSSLWKHVATIPSP